MTLNTIFIDRRVLVTEGLDKENDISRISQLRQFPYVVILGEPGIGKSTVMSSEAAIEDCDIYRVRDILDDDFVFGEETLYVDALDEYRSDGQPADKVHNLAKSIRRTKAKRWRVSCRSEDWRKEADIAPLRRIAADQEIVVAQLLPIDEEEAKLILGFMGEENSSHFVAQAKSLGAQGFLGNPLSLKLLQGAVKANKAWPETRFQLFSEASRRLAFEKNAEHKTVRDRPSVDTILSVASKVFIVQLVSGAQLVWRSNDEPPGNCVSRTYLAGQDLELDPAIFSSVLDTALFRGEGEAFEPIHRTIAEFLAASALSHAIVGKGGAALPLSRALALICGPDGRAPTELRGLYAWLAAHLWKLGHQSNARRMIERDASTVLSYGDAAAFDTHTRRLILDKIGLDDPFFRTSTIGITALGGLAGEDIAADLSEVLEDEDIHSHKFITVLDALSSGKPVGSLQPVLRSIALCPSRPEWQRIRACEAWLAGAADVALARRSIFDDLSAEPISEGREALRLRLAARLPRQKISTAEIRSVIADYQCAHKRSSSTHLYALRTKLIEEPRSDFFDVSTKTWLPRAGTGHRSSDVDNLISHALAASIRVATSASASKIWSWIKNTRRFDWEESKEEVRKALRKWISYHPAREVELFEAMLLDDGGLSWPAQICDRYVRVTGCQISQQIIRHLLRKAANSPDRSTAERELSMAVISARRLSTPDSVFWEVFKACEDAKIPQLSARDLIKTKLPKHTLTEFARAKGRRRKALRRKADNVLALRPSLAEIRHSAAKKPLEWAAEIYFGDNNAEIENNPGIHNLLEHVDVHTVSAIIDGWRRLVIKGDPDLNARSLGEKEGARFRYYAEFGAIAGLHYLTEARNLPRISSIPIELSIVILKSAYVVKNETTRADLERWAIKRLDINPVDGAHQLKEFWGVALIFGATHFESLWRAEEAGGGKAFTLALKSLLYTRPGMNVTSLATFLKFAAKYLDKSILEELSHSALGNGSVVGSQRTIWKYVSFLLDPINTYADIVNIDNPDCLFELLNEKWSEGFAGNLLLTDSISQAYRAAAAIELFGPLASPSEELPSGYVTRAQEAADMVGLAINLLAAETGGDAQRLLRNLMAKPGLRPWFAHLRYALSQQAIIRRDAEFRHPTPAEILVAVGGGAPVNASDLRAVVREELVRLRDELRLSDSTPWKAYWNVNQYGKAIKPKIENECRDLLLERLRDRLTPYKIGAAIPEARRQNETRADMLILTGAGRNLPIEAKRHFHADIWIAAATQLQGYAHAPGADGFGIYLVFWFGNDTTPVPLPPDGNERPKSGAGLEVMLRERLPEPIRSTTDILVFDVSRPEISVDKTANKPRKSKGKPETAVDPAIAKSPTKPRVRRKM